MSTPWIPPRFVTAPRLEPGVEPGPYRAKYALLINPFYPKDPHASFGKHVLTPSLALTSIAGATPPDWEVAYWDENLLQGPPPSDPFPQVVGITVHLTFAERAYELAEWYRRRGAKVILGGLHVLSCPEEVAPHADALAVGEGVQIWPEILRDVEAGTLRPVYRGSYRRPYREDPAPRRDLVPRRGFLTTTSLIATRGCHNRCGFCYLATEGLTMPYHVRDVDQVVAEFRDDGQPYAVFIDNNLGSRPEYLRELCRGLRPLEAIWSAAVTIDVTDDPSLIREMALAGCTGVFVGFESLAGDNLDRGEQEDAQPGRLCAAGGDPARPWNPGQRQLRSGLRPRSGRCLRANRRVDRGGPAGMRHLSYPHALSGHAAIPPDGFGGAAFAQGLAALRHVARGLPAPAHVARGARGGLRLVLRPALLALLDLASTAGRLACRSAVPGDVVPLQAVEPALAPPHSPPADGARVASAGRVHAPSSPPVPASVGLASRSRASAWRGRWSPPECRVGRMPRSGARPTALAPARAVGLASMNRGSTHPTRSTGPGFRNRSIWRNDFRRYNVQGRVMPNKSGVLRGLLSSQTDYP